MLVLARKDIDKMWGKCFCANVAFTEFKVVSRSNCVYLMGFKSNGCFKSDFKIKALRLGIFAGPPVQTYGLLFSQIDTPLSRLVKSVKFKTRKHTRKQAGVGKKWNSSAYPANLKDMFVIK